MSDAPESSPETTPNPPAKAAPRARKAATPRPKKSAKSAAPEIESTDSTAPEPTATPMPELAPVASTEWPEPEAASTGGAQTQSESSKRKRRRRKGKGQGQHSSPPNTAGSSIEEPPAQAPTESKPVAETREPAPRPNPQQQPRPKIDPEVLAKMAWKIYLAEVSEEGVALIGDNDAKDLSRRCFRLAEIFIEEQVRRR